MKREERYEINRIKKGVKDDVITATIMVDGSKEYKKEAYEILSDYRYHPCGITENDNRFDEKKRLVFIKDIYGQNSWKTVYNDEEKKSFADAIGITVNELY